jgi:hypothetical protein
MLSRDPEREVVGRTIAAMLMARQIRATGDIHAESILTEIGALAGFATQMSIRQSAKAGQEAGLGGALVEVVTRGGGKYYFSDLLNWMLFENTSAPPYSIWSYICAVVPEESRASLPDVADIVSYAARTIGTPQFGIPRLPVEHMPRRLPLAALVEHWQAVRDELVACRREPGQWPYDLAVAAQWQMLTSRDTLALPFAAAVVMEAAIPMSKIDPALVPGGA